MKHLAVFLLVCLGLAAAVPLYSNDLKLSEIDGFLLNAEGEDRINDNMKEMYEEMRERLKNVFEDGKGLQEHQFRKAQEVYEKLRNLRNEIADKIKEVYEDIKNRKSQNGPANAGIVFPLHERGNEERMKELFERMVERLRMAFEGGKGVREDLFKKAQDLYEKLNNVGVEISDEVKEAFEEMRNQMSKKGPPSSHADIFSIFEMFKRLRELVKEKLNADELKAKVEKLFGKGSELAQQIINMLKEKGEKGKKKILDWIDRIIPDKEERSISEVYEKIRDFFKDLQIDLKERFTKFGEWVKEQYEEGLERGKTKAENIKRIAKEFLDDTRQISKDVAGEALDFFREYKKDLGIVFDDIRDKARRILKDD